MTSKIRIISADTWRLKRLEDQAALKHEEVVQLRNAVARLRSQYKLQTDTFRLRTELDGTTKLIQQLRIQVLVSLGCNLAEEQYVTAIFTDEATNFWSLVDEVKLRSKTSVSVPQTPVQHEGNTHEGNTSASNLSILLSLTQQCNELDRLAGSLGSGRNERVLRKQCNQLGNLARSYKIT